MTIIVLTGAPGVGKTTAIIRVARALKERGVKVGGIVSRAKNYYYEDRI